jgi:hypothetical protein
LVPRDFALELLRKPFIDRHCALMRNRMGVACAAGDTAPAPGEAAGRGGVNVQKPARTTAPSKTGRCHTSRGRQTARGSRRDLAMAEQFAPTMMLLLTADMALAHLWVSFGGPPPTK